MTCTFRSDISFNSTPPPAAINSTHILWYAAISTLALPNYTVASSA
jgi:hypothetical protein